MFRLIQAQVTQPQPANNSPPPVDPFWSMVGTYGGLTALLLTIGKAYADYQLKAAMEDRALKAKEAAQGLELEGKVMNSLLSQQEHSASSTEKLLNTFIDKTLNQIEGTSEQTASLLATIATLTEAVKFLGDTQHQQTVILYELRESLASQNSELTAFNVLVESISASEELSISLINQMLALLERFVESSAKTNINGEG